MLSQNAAHVYGFDLDMLDAIGAQIGPTVAAVAEPLAEGPADTTCNAFDPDAVVRAW